MSAHDALSGQLSGIADLSTRIIILGHRAGLKPMQAMNYILKGDDSVLRDLPKVEAAAQEAAPSAAKPYEDHVSNMFSMIATNFNLQGNRIVNIEALLCKLKSAVDGIGETFSEPAPPSVAPDEPPARTRFRLPPVPFTINTENGEQKFTVPGWTAPALAMLLEGPASRAELIAAGAAADRNVARQIVKRLNFILPAGGLEITETSTKAENGRDGSSVLRLVEIGAVRSVEPDVSQTLQKVLATAEKSTSMVLIDNIPPATVDPDAATLSPEPPAPPEPAADGPLLPYPLPPKPLEVGRRAGAAQDKVDAFAPGIAPSAIPPRGKPTPPPVAPSAEPTAPIMGRPAKGSVINVDCLHLLVRGPGGEVYKANGTLICKALAALETGGLYGLDGIAKRIKAQPGQVKDILKYEEPRLNAVGIGLYLIGGNARLFALNGVS